MDKNDEFFRYARQAKRASEFKEDEGHFIPWRLGMIYEIEPELENIAKRTISKKRMRFNNRLNAYLTAKQEAYHLIGWSARDPRLRHRKAWDCYFDYILDELTV